MLKLLLLPFLIIPTIGLAQTNAGLNYKDAELVTFIEDVALETRKTIIVSPNVVGKVTLFSSDSLEPELLFETLLAVLKINGFSVSENSAGVYKITRIEDAIADSNITEKGKPAEQFATRVFKINFIDSDVIAEAIRPSLNPKGILFFNKGVPLILVSDTIDKLKKIENIISNLDVDSTEIEIIKLQNTSAKEMSDIAKSFVGSTINDNISNAIKFVPISSNNSLLVKGQQEALNLYLPIIKKIDADNLSRSDIRVYKVSYVDANQLIPVLNQIVENDNLYKDKSETLNNISLFKGGNTIIVNGDEKLQKKIGQIIEQLDVPQAQVLVEAIIVEISTNMSKKLGLQYILAGGEGSDIPFSISNYSSSAPNILAATGALILNDDDESNGLSLSNSLKTAAIDSLLGIDGFAIGGAGTKSDGSIFGVILNAIKRDSDSNILSTPSLMTLNNEPASFIVGQEIPITTGEALSNSNSNPFRTIERKNVGVQLEIEPQINEGNELRLKVRQEVSSVSGTLVSGSSELITNKREMETTVRVSDGEIIVLGGLIQEEESLNADKTPLLGEIPLLGNAFKSQQKAKNKTNLVIFLRPTVIRDKNQMRDISNARYNSFNEVKKGSKSNLSIDEFFKK